MKNGLMSLSLERSWDFVIKLLCHGSICAVLSKELLAKLMTGNSGQWIYSFLHIKKT